MNIGNLYKIKDQNKQPWSFAKSKRDLELGTWSNDENIDKYLDQFFILVFKEASCKSYYITSTIEYDIGVLINNKILYTTINEFWFKKLFEKVIITIGE